MRNRAATASIAPVAIGNYCSKFNLMHRLPAAGPGLVTGKHTISP